jgi:hypothetical protein
MKVKAAVALAKSCPLGRMASARNVKGRPASSSLKVAKSKITNSEEASYE